ncbi:hypothetical protein AGIG_G4650 [Arapaima gigas]
MTSLQKKGLKPAAREESPVRAERRPASRFQGFPPGIRTGKQSDRSWSAGPAGPETCNSKAGSRERGRAVAEIPSFQFLKCPGGAAEKPSSFINGDLQRSLH